jgi:hypothetical protein
MRGTQRQFSGMPLGPVEKPVEKFLSSAFSTEIAVTATKQSENLFPATRIYIAEPATLVLAVKKGPPSPGTSGPLYCRTFVLQDLCIAGKEPSHVDKPDQPIASRQIRPGPFLFHSSLFTSFRRLSSVFWSSVFRKCSKSHSRKFDSQLPQSKEEARFYFFACQRDISHQSGPLGSIQT